MLRQRHAVVGPLVLVLLGANDLTEGVFECEHALVHLMECCPDIISPGSCSEQQSCMASRKPVFVASESRCIQALDCDRLNDEGVCARAEAAFMDPRWDGASARWVCVLADSEDP